jgi:hypothetical protein
MPIASTKGLLEHKEMCVEVGQELDSLMTREVDSSGESVNSPNPRYAVTYRPNIITPESSEFKKETKSDVRSNVPQGKVAELRQELLSGGKKDKNHSAKKIALKKIVANMTMSNNDMVGLFPDIIACMQTPSLEIKKM